MQTFTLGLTMLLSFLGLALAIPVFAPLLLGGGADPANAIVLGLLIATYPLCGLFGTPATEALSNRIGRKPAMLTTLFFSAIGYAICALGILYHHIGLLFLSRIIGGFAGSSGTIVIQSAMDQRDASKRGSRMKMLATLGGLGFLIGPLLGGKLADPAIISWFTDQTPFWVGAALILLNLFWVTLFFKETIEFKSKTPFDLLRGCRNLIAPFKIASVRRLAWILLLFGTAWSLFVDFFPVYLVQKWDLHPAQIGDFYIYVTAWYFLTQWFLLGPASRWIRRPGLAATLLLVAPFSFLLLLIPWETNWLYFCLPPTIIVMTMSLPLLYNLLPSATEWESNRQLARVSHALQTGGYIAAPILGGLLAAWFYPLPTLAAAICALLAWLLLVGRKRRPTAQ